MPQDFHNIDFTTGCPNPVFILHRQHPNRRQQSLPDRETSPRLNPSIFPISTELRIQSCRGVVFRPIKPSVTFLSRLNHQQTVFYPAILRLIRVVLELIVPAAIRIHLVHPFRTINLRPIEFVAPNQSPLIRKLLSSIISLFDLRFLGKTLYRIIRSFNGISNILPILQILREFQLIKPVHLYCGTQVNRLRSSKHR